MLLQFIRETFERFDEISDIGVAPIAREARLKTQLRPGLGHADAVADAFVVVSSVIPIFRSFRARSSATSPTKSSSPAAIAAVAVAAVVVIVSAALTSGAVAVVVIIVISIAIAATIVTGIVKIGIVAEFSLPTSCYLAAT
jgi:hypothetical protein